MRPDLVTAIWLPAGRGELPQVSVTVATATCSPAARQAAAVPRTSSASMRAHAASFQAVRRRRGRGAGRDSRSISARRLARLCTGRNSSTCGSIARMPCDFGSNPLPAQQRVEPDQPRGRTGAAGPCSPPARAAPSRSSPSVISSTTAPWPSTRRAQSRLKLVQRLADAGAAGPVGHGVGDHLERHLRIAGAQLAGDVGQPRAEQEDVDAVAVVGHRVQEVQQDLRVAAHRAGDVAQHDQRRRAGHAAVAGDGQDFAALAQAGADGARAGRSRGPRRIRPQPAGAAQVQRQHQAADLRFARRRFRRRPSPRNPSSAAAPGRRRSAPRRSSAAPPRASASVASRLAHRLGDAAAAGRRASPAWAPSARPAAPSPRPARRPTGSRQNSANAWSNTSWCSWRWIITVRSAVRAWSRSPRSIWVSACCAAIVSAGPTGRPARRSSRAKCMTLAASVPPRSGTCRRQSVHAAWRALAPPAAPPPRRGSLAMSS